MQKLLFTIVLLFSVPAMADSTMTCGKIERIRTWSYGSDTYGIWVEFQSNPSDCSGGFYIPHQADNKEFVYSLLLAGKAANQSLCIQRGNLSSNIGDRCMVNYVMHE